MDKMSDSLSSVATSGFKNPRAPQRERELAIALYYAQLAWNEANGDPVDPASIEQVRRQMGIPNRLPSSFRTSDADVLLEHMVKYKQKHFPADDRVVVAALFEDERLRVHWREACVS